MSITKVTGNVLADDAVTAVKIPADAVGSSEIADDAVTTAKIADSAITDAKISAVAASKLSGIVADARFPATLPTASGANLTSLNASNLGSGTVPTARLGSGTASSSTFLRGDQTYAEVGGGGGKVLQVLQATKTDTTSLSSTSWTDVTGMSQSITPSATSSKILVIADCITSGASGVMAKLVRGSTDIAIGDTDGSRERVSFGSTDGKGGSQVEPWTIIWLDSPSTTSATTYKLQWRAQGGGTHYFNRSANDANNTHYTRSVSTLTLIEIGA